MYEVGIERQFRAAHALRLADGQMEPMHTHDWLVTVNVAAPQLDAQDVVIDFHDLETSVDVILAELADRTLNELPPFAHASPSAERVAEHIASQLIPQLPQHVRLVRVTVTEAPGCMASYLP